MENSILDNRVNQTLGYLKLAYNDYIAARVLLNKNYTLQGVTLASTAIEKYFKAAIFMFTGKRPEVHLDRFQILEKEISAIGYQILFDKIDPGFLNILSKAYQLRYYDKLMAPITIGFFKNQFLGELDGAVELLERLFILKHAKTGAPILSPLKWEYKAGNNDLLKNNWVATEKKDKKAFMETGCEGFAIHILPGNLFNEINVSSKKMDIPYQGKMILIDVKPDK